MEETQYREKIIGYEVNNNNSLDGVFIGVAQINGECVEHQLSMCTRPAGACDVGRNADGDVVWVSPLSVSEKMSQPEHTLFLTSEPELDHEPLEMFTSHVSRGPAEFLVSLWRKLQRHRTKGLFVLGVASVLVVVGFLIPVTEPTSARDLHEATAQTDSPSQSKMPFQDASEAAIQFVVNGEVSGVDLPAGMSAEDLSATVVSQSGEIVLVDVSINAESGLTTFATLLLQKSGTAWRIREVFDPR